MSQNMENPQVKVEGRDIKVHVVVIVALVFLAILVAIHFALAGFWDLLAAREAPARTAGVLPPPPEPRLQAAPAQDLAALTRGQQERLHSYGWVERKKGVVHIPIERAMELSAKP